MATEASDTGEPRLYITYPRVPHDDADFAHLAFQLKTVGLEVTYDTIEFGPGQNLWERISARIRSGDIAAWAYLLTPRGLANRTCLNQLQAALDRVCESRGSGFTLVGLLHGIAAENLPPGLRLRPCVHLADPGWKEKVRSLVMARAAGECTQFAWTVHTGFGGDPAKTAIEVAPRREGMRFWRFAVPSSTRPVRWGHGPSGGGELAPVLFSVVKGAGRLQHSEINWFGSEDLLAQNESAYVIFEGRIPEFVCFGQAANRSAPPGKMEIFRPSLSKQ